MAGNDQENLIYKQIWHIFELILANFADFAEVTRPTLAYLENLTAVLQQANSASVEAIARVYTDRGIRFVFQEGDGGIGVRLIGSSTEQN